MRRALRIALFAPALALIGFCVVARADVKGEIHLSPGTNSSFGATFEFNKPVGDPAIRKIDWRVTKDNGPVSGNQVEGSAEVKARTIVVKPAQPGSYVVHVNVIMEGPPNSIEREVVFDFKKDGELVRNPAPPTSIVAEGPKAAPPAAKVAKPDVGDAKPAGGAKTQSTGLIADFVSPNLVFSVPKNTVSKGQIDKGNVPAKWQVFRDAKELAPGEFKPFGTFLKVPNPLPNSTYSATFTFGKKGRQKAVSGSYDVPPAGAEAAAALRDPEGKEVAAGADDHPDKAPQGPFSDTEAEDFVEHELLDAQKLPAKDPKFRTHLSNLQKQLAALKTPEKSALAEMWGAATEMNAFGPIRSIRADFRGRGVVFADIDWAKAWDDALTALETHLDDLDNDARLNAYAALSRALAGETRNQEAFLNQLYDHLASTNSSIVSAAAGTVGTRSTCDGCGKCWRCRRRP